MATTNQKIEELTYDQFVEQFKPLTRTDPKGNKIEFFDTSEADKVEELRKKKNYDYHHIWTLVSGDTKSWWVCEGYHLVNRMAYIITEEPWQDKTYYVIEY